MIEIASELGKKYYQESILLKYPEKEKKGKAILVYPKSNEIEEIGTGLGYDKISFAYSKLKSGSHTGRSFIIEGIRVPNNHIDAISLNKQKILF